MAKNILTSATELAQKIAAENGCYLYDAEYQKEGKNQVLRIYVDKDGGINIDECETVSRNISEALDQENLIQTAYHLEVSSPGAERKLSKEWHFEKVLGKKIEVSLYAPVDGTKNVIGTLEKFENNIIFLSVNGNPMEFSKDKVASSKLYFDITEALKTK
ncbi:MAG: ribosome maturation factor RimP [Clostridia bacterium]|nr:ribosome maturation factor RimP [Clostridia bacterium]